MKKAPFLLAAIFLSGCATTLPPRPAIVPFPTAQRVAIGSVGYLPSSVVAQQVRGQGRWDLEAQVWSLSVGSHELRAAPQIPVVVVDGVSHPLATAPLLRDGELLLPETLWGWVAPWITPVPPPTRPGPMPARRTIVVDPGHGGYDRGAVGHKGLAEKTVNLDIALRLQDILERDGFQVVMTRQTDRFVPLNVRSEIANRGNGDLFVSIHSNASRRRSASGFEVYYLSEATDDHARAIEAAENGSLPAEVGESVPDRETQAIVWDLLYTEHRAESTELAAAVCRGLKGRIPSQNRGVKSARFFVLKGSRMPAILVEVGFITHLTEESRLKNPSYRQTIAEGIRSGILAFEAEYERRI